MPANDDDDDRPRKRRDREGDPDARHGRSDGDHRRRGRSEDDDEGWPRRSRRSEDSDDDQPRGARDSEDLDDWPRRSRRSDDDRPIINVPKRRKESGFSFCNMIGLPYVAQCIIALVIGFILGWIGVEKRFHLQGLVFLALVFFVWAGAAFAKSKGDSEWLGFVVIIFPLVGVLYLLYLPNRNKNWKDRY